MASSVFCRSLAPPAPPPSSLLPSPSRRAANSSNSQWIKSSVASKLESSKSRGWSDEGRAPETNRRDLLLHILLLSGFSSPAFASDTLPSTDVQGGFRTYEDEANKFRILVPPGWLVGAGDADNFKSVTAFYPEEAASDSSVAVAITGIGADFTSLKSFGTVDAFAESLVSGLDRSWNRPPGLAAKLVDCRAANGLYYIEYTLQNPGEKCRHLYSAIGMASNGWYNRLYTVTGQFVEDQSDKYQPEIQKAVSSFRLT